MPEPVIVVPYNSEWPRRFAEEAAILGTVFAGSDAVIEHIGSTAVPGLGAKPVIDIMVGLRHLTDRALAVRVSKAEYTDAKSPFIEGILEAARLAE